MTWRRHSQMRTTIFNAHYIHIIVIIIIIIAPQSRLTFPRIFRIFMWLICTQRAPQRNAFMRTVCSRRAKKTRRSCSLWLWQFRRHESITFGGHFRDRSAGVWPSRASVQRSMTKTRIDQGDLVGVRRVQRSTPFDRCARCDATRRMVSTGFLWRCFFQRGSCVTLLLLLLLLLLLQQVIDL